MGCFVVLAGSRCYRATVAVRVYGPDRQARRGARQQKHEQPQAVVVGFRV